MSHHRPPIRAILVSRLLLLKLGLLNLGFGGAPTAPSPRPRKWVISRTVCLVPGLRISAGIPMCLPSIGIRLR
eukprot:8702627-Pyramimonas_sp.AAC.1